MIPLAEQIKCVEREIAMRKRVYPRWVAGDRMTKAKADHEIAAMEAVLATLRRLDQAGQLPLARDGMPENFGEGEV